MNKLIVKETVFSEGTARVCVPIIDAKKDDIINSAKAIRDSKAEVVEWRCDFFENYKDISEVVDIIKELSIILKNKPIIFTFRTKAEGGLNDISAAEYSLLYKTVVLSKKIDFIDVEVMREDAVVSNIIRHAQSNGIYVILSNHDMHATPPQDKLLQRMKRMQEKGADVVKIACMPRNEQDVKVVKDIATEMKKQKALFLAIAMGELGVSTRKDAKQLGSCITFGYLLGASAPGQIHIDEIV